jgi:hypothetical protein
MVRSLARLSLAMTVVGLGAALISRAMFGRVATPAHRLRRDHKTVGGLAWTLCTCHFRRKGSPATSP